MSYIRAEEVLPKELIETIQQYVNGKAIYIPSTSKKEWGSHTDTLSEKSIQRIVREGKRKSGKL